MRLRPRRHIESKLFGGLILQLLIICLIACAAEAQTIAVSEEVSLRNDQAYFIVGKFDETLLLMRDQDTEVEIHAFDSELREKWSRTIEYEKKNSEVFSVINTDTSFHVFYTAIVKKGTTTS